MNNEQFRRLMANKPEQQNPAETPRTGATPSSLGAKKSSFMPMTPRTVKGGIDVDFGRQVRERNAALQPKKKFKSSAPKGSKFGSGYTDRAKARAEGEDGDNDAADKAERIKALEEQMKLDQISPETFEALRDQITGGDVSSTHLVKGLDRQLLERVRRGEDVLGLGNGDGKQEEAGQSPDVEDELDRLGEKDVETVKKEKTEKRGAMAPPPIAGKKRTRDEIMADLKAQRKAAADARAAADPTLSGKWAKVGDKKKSRIEVDEKGREVLITVDEKGVVKRRVRKAQQEPEKPALAAPDADKAILGADVAVPQSAKLGESVPEEDDDDDIFEGVGAEYNPLGNASEDDEDSDEDGDDDHAWHANQASTTADTVQDGRAESVASIDEDSAQEQSPAPPHESPPKPATSRNYFGDKPNSTEEAVHNHLSGIQEVLKKAAKMDPLRSTEDGADGDADAAANEARAKKHAQMLANQDRDLEDMDMGFGSSRFEDEVEGEGEGKKVKLSEWKGTADDGGWEEDDGKGAGKKKRKPKKRKGDASNMGDIMRVIEGRKGAAAK